MIHIEVRGQASNLASKDITITNVEIGIASSRADETFVLDTNRRCCDVSSHSDDLQPCSRRSHQRKLVLPAHQFMPDITGQTKVRNNTNTTFYLRVKKKKAQKTDSHLEYEYISIATMNAAHERVPHSPPVLHCPSQINGSLQP